MGELPAAATGVVSLEWNACSIGLPQRRQQTNSLSTACENLQHPKLHYPPHLLCQLLALLVALQRAAVALQRLREQSGTQAWQAWAELQPAGFPAAASPAVQASQPVRLPKPSQRNQAANLITRPTQPAAAAAPSPAAAHLVHAPQGLQRRRLAEVALVPVGAQPDALLRIRQRLGRLAQLQQRRRAVAAGREGDAAQGREVWACVLFMLQARMDALRREGRLAVGPCPLATASSNLRLRPGDNLHAPCSTCRAPSGQGRLSSPAYTLPLP